MCQIRKAFNKRWHIWQASKTKKKCKNKSKKRKQKPINYIHMCKLLKIKLNTPANVHPPVVVVVVVVVVVRFVLCRFLSSGHAAYSRSPSFVSLLLMLHHKHTKLGVFRLSLSLSVSRAFAHLLLGAQSLCRPCCWCWHSRSSRQSEMNIKLGQH